MKKNEQISTTFVRQFKHLTKLLTVAISRCPDDLWDRPKTQTADSPAWTAYHAVVTLAMPHMLNIPSFEFPFELEDGFKTTKAEVKSILRDAVDHIFVQYDGMADGELLSTDHGEAPGVRNLIYTLRHTQHHVSEFMQILRENGVKSPGWSTANMM